MRTKKEQLGSLFYWEDRGCWCADITVGYNDAGKRKRKRIYGKSRDEVLQQKKLLEAAVVRNEYVEPTRMTTADFLNKWMASITLRPTTIYSYQGMIDNHVIPNIGNIQLDKLTPLLLQSMFTTDLKQKLSARSIQYLYAILHKAFKQAVQWQIISRSPIDAIERPRSPKKEIHPLNQQQVEKLFEVAEGKNDYALYVTAITTGMRQGELLALNWRDVDIEHGTISVKWTLREINGKLSLGPVKSKASRRIINLPKKAVEAIQGQQGKSELVFPDAKGGYIRKQNLGKRFKKLLTAAELPATRFHDLRHTHATLLLQQGVHPKIVQERLGHSSISITLDTYSHILPSMQQKAVEELDKLF